MKHKSAAIAIIVAAALPLLLGTYAIFVVSAQYSGLGLLDSHRAFQTGSNVGNAISFVVWWGTAAIICRTLIHFSSARGRIHGLKAAAFALVAYAVPAIQALYPDTAMGFAVSHVRAFTDETVMHSGIVTFLVQSGIVALALAAVLFVVDIVRQKANKPRPANDAA